MALDWKIYYGNGVTFSNEDGDPVDAPRRGVQAIVTPDEQVGFHVMTGEDFYWWEFDYDEWFMGDIFGLWDYLCRPGYKIVAFGRSLPDENYRAVLEKARNDPDFPEKSARRADEPPIDIDAEDTR